jgi:ribosomal protein S27AE
MQIFANVCVSPQPPSGSIMVPGDVQRATANGPEPRRSDSGHRPGSPLRGILAPGISASFWEPLGASGSLCEPLGASGSLWEPLGASGSLWEPLGASGSLWEPLGTSGSFWELLGASGSLWEPLGASGSLWEPLRASGSFWEPLGASGSLWEPPGASGPSRRQQQEVPRCGDGATAKHLQAFACGENDTMRVRPDQGSGLS